MKNTKLVPELRFPGFGGEWKQKKFRKILSPVSKPVDVEKQKLYYQIGVRSHGRGIFHKEAVTGAELGNKRVFWVVPGCIIFNIVFAWEGALAVTSDDEEGKIASHRFPMYQAKNNEASLKYLQYYLGTKRGTFLLRLASPGGAGRNKTLGKENFYKTKVPLPSPTEQQKIATFFSLVDRRLAAARRRVVLLEEWKRGVIRKIFLQESNLSRSWEYVPLSKIAKRIKLKNKDNKVKFVLSNTAKNGIVPQENYFDRDIVNTKNTGGYYVVHPDDFVYNPRISNHAPVGPISRNHNQTGIMSPLYDVFRINEGNLSFYESYWQSTDWHRYMNSVANFGVRHDRMNISTADFMNMPVPLPPLAEQTRIATILTTIDARLDAARREVTTYKHWKKGLLQKMLV